MQRYPERRRPLSMSTKAFMGPIARCLFQAPAAIAVLLVILTGCTVGPDFRPPQPVLPDDWHGAPPPPVGGIPPATADLSQWWTIFGDPTLSALIVRATAANLDLQLAEARIRQARAARAVAGGGLGPTLDAAGSYQRSRTPTTTAAGEHTGVTGDQYQAGFDAGWEIDIFGGQRRNREAADADLLAAVESRRDGLVSLTAEVARNYILLRAGQQQLAITRKNLAAQRHSARLTRQRFAGGLVGGLDVVSADAQVATTAARIPLLESSVRQTIYRLGILMGQPPAALVEALSPEGAIPLAPPAVPVGVPSDLLRRRPDIRMAEANIHAATARVGVATAELFPRFTISGSAGYRAADAAALFETASHFWSLGPSVSWRLFESGRLRAGVAVEQTLADQALITYRQTVLGALQEVENALVASEKEQQHRDALQVATTANRKAVMLAGQLYTEGLTDFINVLQAQQALFTTEDALVQSQADMATYLVSLYKALGGGWDDEPMAQDGSPTADPAPGGAGLPADRIPARTNRNSHANN